MNKIKKSTFIVIALLSSIAFISSCSKESESVKKTNMARDKRIAEQAKQKAKISQATKASATFSKGNTSLTAIRDGQNVNLNWIVDTADSTIAKIVILRSSTGAGKNRKVAELYPQATNYTDCLPDENAYWYLLQIFMVEKKRQDIGPVKVEADKTGAAHYINVKDKYKTSVVRTFESATITWSFPDDEYETINIFRNTRPVDQLFGSRKSKIKPVATTLSEKSQHIDSLPDENSEYWYWFQITLKSGAVIYKGPIKAEYASQ